MAAQVSIGTLDGLNLQRAVFNNAAASGDTTAVTGVTGQIIRVYKIVLGSAAVNAITFKDGASTALSGPVNTGAAATANQIVLPFDGQPWYVTSAANNFVINSSAAVSLGGTVYFTQGPGTQS